MCQLATYVQLNSSGYKGVQEVGKRFVRFK
jgi:hypothetical protein